MKLSQIPLDSANFGKRIDDFREKPQNEIRKTSFSSGE